MEQVKGLEPLSSAWKAEVIPLYDTCMVRSTGFEPVAVWLEIKCSIQLSYERVSSTLPKSTYDANQMASPTISGARDGGTGELFHKKLYLLAFRVEG